MIHGIYLRSNHKNKWHLVSMAISAEAANHEINEVRKQAVLDGKETAEVAMKIFDSSLWVPEYINEIIDQKPAFN